MAGLLMTTPDKLLTYQDLMTMFQVLSTKTVARILHGCRRFKPTPGTVRFRESDVSKFIEGKLDAKPDRSPDTKPDRVTRTKRPVSASK